MLGPEWLNPSSSKESIFEQLQHELRQLNHTFTCYTEDSFFNFNKKPEKDIAYFDIAEFYRLMPLPPITEHLLKIPFHLIVNLSPDDLLEQAYQKASIPFEFDYHKNQRKKILDELPEGKRNIYHLLGSIEDEESLVFTFDEMVELLLQGSDILPEAIRKEIHRASYFIFLGFKLDKWHLKVLLKLVGLDDEKLIHITDSASAMPTSSNIFYKDQFNAIFVDKSITEFASELAKNWDHPHNASPQTNITQLIESIKEILIESIEDAITQLKASLKNLGFAKLYDRLLLIEARFQDLIEDHYNNMITKEQYEVSLARTRKSILHILGNIQ